MGGGVKAAHPRQPQGDSQAKGRPQIKDPQGKGNAHHSRRRTVAALDDFDPEHLHAADGQLRQHRQGAHQQVRR